jgi:hypothetical protein
MSSSQQQPKPVLSYKSACMATTAAPVIKPAIANSNVKKEPSYEEKWEKALQILSTRWEQYKNDYIELYGEDTYEYMYKTPNYWVMPEDIEEESESEEEYYDSYDEYYNSDDYEKYH